MLKTSWTFFIWALLGVSRAQVEGAMPSMRGYPTTQLQYTEKRHHNSYGTAKQLENPVENTACNTTLKNASAAMSHSSDTDEPSSVTRPAITNWRLRKTLRTSVQADHKMSLLTQTVQETMGVSPPEANSEDSGTSVACRVLTKGNICVRNTVQEILGGSETETGNQENGSAKLEQNQTHPRWVPVRPGNRPNPKPPKPKPPKPYRPPLWHKPLKPKPKPDYDTGGSNNYDAGGSNNYNHQIKPRNNTNEGVSAHWTISVPVLTGLLVVHHVF